MKYMFTYCLIMGLLISFNCQLISENVPNKLKDHNEIERILEIFKSLGIIIPDEFAKDIEIPNLKHTLFKRVYKKVSFSIDNRILPLKEKWIGFNIYYYKLNESSLLNNLTKHIIIKNGLIIEIYQNYQVFQEPSTKSVVFGNHFKFKDGFLEEFTCNHQIGNDSEKCDDSIFLNPNSSIKDIITHKRKCNQGCGQFQPLRQPGEYFISTDKVRVREDPDPKSKIITELSKDMKVEVIKDAEKYESIGSHLATWGKVKLDDGREGYVYGAFLRAPGEPDVVAIREKAEEWKKKNGWKGK